MKRILRIAALLLVLLPGIAKAQWTFDIVSVEAYINDHKKMCIRDRRTTETIAGMYGGRVSDESCHYAEYKDLNDYLRGKKR